MKYLALDLGTKTLGVAISDNSNTIALNYDIIRFSDFKNIKVLNELEKIITSNEISCIILGLPKNMNNTISQMAENAILFKSIIEDRFNIKVVMEDERLTSKISNDVLINANMRRNKRKKLVDGMAATIILQSYLDKINFRKDKE